MHLFWLGDALYSSIPEHQFNQYIYKLLATNAKGLPLGMPYWLLVRNRQDREMFRQILVAIITALIFVPSSVEAGVIQYQEVALRYTIGTLTRDLNDGESSSDFRATQIESNPQNARSSAAIDQGSSVVELTFDLDEENNTFSCLLYTSPSPRDATLSRMPSSA